MQKSGEPLVIKPKLFSYLFCDLLNKSDFHFSLSIEMQILIYCFLFIRQISIILSRCFLKIIFF